MIENTILKMEYAEVRVFSISDKVGPKVILLCLPFWEVLHTCVSFFFSESDHSVSLGSAVVGYPYQSVVQSAVPAASSVCYAAVPGGDIVLRDESECSLSYLFSVGGSQKKAMDFFIVSGSKIVSSHLQVLEADNNLIKSLEGVYDLPKLEEVLLRNNSILNGQVLVKGLFCVKPVHPFNGVLVTQELCESASRATQQPQVERVKSVRLKLHYT